MTVAEAAAFIVDAGRGADQTGTRSAPPVVTPAGVRTTRPLASVRKLRVRPMSSGSADVVGSYAVRSCERTTFKVTLTSAELFAGRLTCDGLTV